MYIAERHDGTGELSGREPVHYLLLLVWMCKCVLETEVVAPGEGGWGQIKKYTIYTRISKSTYCLNKYNIVLAEIFSHSIVTYCIWWWLVGVSEDNSPRAAVTSVRVSANDKACELNVNIQYLNVFDPY